jgi:hypothetical protein
VAILGFKGDRLPSEFSSSTVSTEDSGLGDSIAGLVRSSRAYGLSYAQPKLVGGRSVWNDCAHASYCRVAE